MTLLAPYDRTPLLDALRPPAGCVLDAAIGTTFTLDLVALLTAPVGFTFFELEEGASALGDQAPLELLEAIRRHASQILVFCEVGRIAVPSKHRPLFSFLENCIVQAKAPSASHAFHPKLWVIRYVGDDGTVQYRLLCMSRNLTFDRSLDTLLVLDGTLRSHRSMGFGVNRPLTEFVQALPEMAVRELTEAQAEQCRLVASEIGRVDWDLEGLPAEEIDFWPLGIGKRQSWPFEKADGRILVASPFVTGSTLQELTARGSGHILIGRQDELDKLDKRTLERFSGRYVIRSQLEAEESPAESEETVAPHDLHAKLYIADRGWDASLWTGSANATHAAFGGNVEFLVELKGRKKKLGVDAFLAKHSGTVSIRDLLDEYQRPESTDPDADLEALDQAIEGVRRELAVLPWYVSVSPGSTAEHFVVTVGADGEFPMLPQQVQVTLRLLSLGAATAVRLSEAAGAKVTFEDVGLESLTAFVALELSATQNGKTRNSSFVVNAKLVGDPPNRRDRLIRSMLSDRRAVVRYLLLLLAEVNEDVEFALGVGSGPGRWGSTFSVDQSEALLEPLLRTFQRDHARLTAVASLVRDLSSASDTASLVPEGLLHLIEVLDAARDEVAK